ncbi:MAG: PEP-CTERM sorting domain-containing protein [Alphaproteobacteria bacterium]
MTNSIIRSALALATTVMIGSAASSASAFTTFFGEDISNSASTPLASFPNATAAEAQFLSSLTGVGTETFESFADNTGGPLNLNFPGAGMATMSGGNGRINSVPVGSTNSVGRYGVSGTNYWEVAAGGTGNFTVNFSEPVTAFGFYGIDIGDFGGQVELVLNDVNNTRLTVNNTIGSSGSTDGSVLFFGLIAEIGAEQFTSISFETTTGQGDYFAFENLTVGFLSQVTTTAVPEPSIIALLGVGFVAIGFACRRNR